MPPEPKQLCQVQARNSEGFQLILSMCLKFQILVEEHLITGWGKKKGRKKAKAYRDNFRCGVSADLPLGLQQQPAAFQVLCCCSFQWGYVAREDDGVGTSASTSLSPGTPQHSGQSPSLQSPPVKTTH